MMQTNHFSNHKVKNLKNKVWPPRKLIKIRLELDDIEISISIMIDRYLINQFRPKYKTRMTIKMTILKRIVNPMNLYRWKLRVLKRWITNPKSKIYKIIMMMKNFWVYHFNSEYYKCNYWVYCNYRINYWNPLLLWLLTKRI